MTFFEVVSWILSWIYARGAYLAILNIAPRWKHQPARLPPSGFPIDRLPPELLYLVFAAADKSDILNLRLTCKALAAVGVDRLFAKAELLFTRSSFDRLTRMSPVYGRHVKTLVYRVDLLRRHFDMDEYIRGLACHMIDSSRHPGSKWAVPKPSPGASDGEWRQYEINVARRTDPNIQYGKQRLEIGWAAYRKLWLEQEHLRHQSYGEDDIIRMVAQLPNLKNIILSNFDHANGPKSIYFQSVYQETLMEADGDEGYGEYCGVPQLLSIVRALHQAGTRIETLTANLVSWHLFEASKNDFDLLKNVFRNLKILRMWFTADQTFEWVHPDEMDHYERLRMEDDGCWDFLKSGPGRYIELFRSMTNLRVLDLCFYAYEVIYFDFKSVFRDIQWPFLREVALNCLQGTDDDLLKFLKKHAATLKVVQLYYYKLTQGLWLYTFREMRESLSLEVLRIAGPLENEGYGEKDAWKGFLDGGRRYKEKQEIQDYVQGSQTVSLGNIIDHGKSCSCQGGPYDDMHTSTPGLERN